MICHVVLFSPRPDADVAIKRALAQQVVEALRGIKSIRRAVVGRAVSIDPGYQRQMGHEAYEFACVIDFDDADGLKDYLNDPAHAELGRLFWAVCERTVVSEVETVDLQSQDAVDLLAK